MVLSIIGHVETEEVQRAFAEALADARFQIATRLLWDARRSETALSSADLEARCELLSSLADRGLLSRVAALLGTRHRTSLSIFQLLVPKGMARLPVAVFDDEAEAKAWLGLSLPEGS